jgi:peroxiredoxin
LDAADIAPQRGRGQRGDDDSRFPVGISRRAEILNHIEEMDREGGKEPAKRQKKAREREADEVWDRGERPAGERDFESFLDEGEEEEKPRKSKAGGIAATVISIVLIIVLVFGALYIYNNFDDVTKWLAAPTVPETIKPSEQPADSANSGQNPFAGLLAALGWGKAQAGPAENASSPAATSNETATAPVQPAAPSDTTLPVISDILIKSITDHGAVVTWKTDEPCTSRISYKTEVGERYNRNGAVTASRYHQADLSELESGKTYYLTIICQDVAGNEGRQERTFQTLLSAADTAAPQLAGEPLVSVGDSSATISWKTSEKAKSQVRYSLGTGYEFPSGSTYDFSYDHSISLNGLSPNTVYHYQLISRDAAGNVMTSGDFSFKTEPETGTSPYMGSKAPNFTLKNLQGEDVSLSQYRGKKVILNFWASWCTPCKIELPHFQAIWDKYGTGGDFVILTVAGSQSEEDAIRSFIANGNYTFPVCLDPGEDAFNKYELTSIPKTYFIDKDGVIRRIQQGMFTSPGEIEFMLGSY